MLKKSTLLSVSIFVLLFIGLSDYGYGCHKGEQHGKFTNCPPPDPEPSGGTDKYSVSVEFADTECGTSMGNRDYFCSDDGFQDNGSQLYDDGDDNVSAVGDKFRLSLTLQAAGFRRFFLDFSDNCFDDTCGVIPVVPVLKCLGEECNTDKGLTSGTTDNVFSIGEPPFSLLDMAPGASEERNLFISFRDNDGDGWGLSFSPDDCVDSDDVSVTRAGDTWYFTPNGEGRACLTRAKNGKSGPPILQGLYKVPFGFLVTLLD